MNQHDAWVVKNMYNLGASILDIAYALDCSERTVRRCIDRGFTPTPKKQQIADRQEHFFPSNGTGNYRAHVHTRDGEEKEQQELQSFYSEQESYLEARDRLSEEIDQMDVERLISML